MDIALSLALPGKKGTQPEHLAYVLFPPTVFLGSFFTLTNESVRKTKMATADPGA